MRSLKRLSLVFAAAVVVPALALALNAANAAGATGAVGAIERAQSQSEQQIRNLLEPILEKYCRDQCKLMSVKASVDIAVPEEVSPGFDDVDPQSASRLAPSEARARILMDEKIGPISQRKLLDLVQRHLDTLEYPVKVETQQAHFPQPLGISGKVAELREKVSRKFRDTLQQVLTQFCPDHCLAADFDLVTETVNAEEAQYGATNEFYEDGGVAIRVKSIGATLLMDEALTPEEQQNVLEVAKLRTNDFRNAALALKSMKFPDLAYGRDGSGRKLGYGRGLASGTGSDQSSKDSSESNSQRSDKSESIDQKLAKDESQSTSRNSSDSRSTNNSSEANQKQERFERFEKIERVESGDAVQAELQKIKVYALVFSCAVLSLLIFIALSTFRARGGSFAMPGLSRFMGGQGAQPHARSSDGRGEPAASDSKHGTADDLGKKVAIRYEIERLTEELLSIFAQNPKVAKQVFSRVLTEEGVEVTAACISVFGESIVIDMLRDPSLQADINELMEFYAKTPIELEDGEKLDLLKRLHNRTVAGKLVVLGNRSSHQFDFLADMDGLQILELVRNESLTVKAIIVTQCDPQKRAAIYAQLDDDTRMKLLAELSRIDYLPRDYITNVAAALKRKRQENPRLNTEALPGSDVLVNLLERSGPETQMALIKNLERANPDSARVVKNKLVSLGTLRYLRDHQLLEVVLSLRHDELLQFMKGVASDVRSTILAKSPKDLSIELEEELAAADVPSREIYQSLERKVLNRLKVMSNDGLINLAETNERMFAEARGLAAVPDSVASGARTGRAGGW